jgi:hypothetical protein
VKLTILPRLIIRYLLVIIVVIICGVYTLLSLYQLNAMIADMTIDARLIRLSAESLNVFYTASAAEEKYTVSRDPYYKEQDYRKQEYWQFAATAGFSGGDHTKPA